MARGSKNKKAANGAPQPPPARSGIAEFQDMLVLFKWAMRIFRTEQEPLLELGAKLNKPEFEGYANDGHTLYYCALRDNHLVFELHGLCLRKLQRFGGGAPKSTPERGDAEISFR